MYYAIGLINFSLSLKDTAMISKKTAINSAKTEQPVKKQHRINLLIDRELFKLARIESVRDDLLVGNVIDKALAARYASQLNQSADQ